MMMKYITVLLLAVFLIPFVQNVDAQSVLGPTSGGLGGGIKEIPSGGGQTANNTAGQVGQSAQNTTGQVGQPMNNTSQQAGQSASNATSQSNNGTSSGNPIMDMLGKIIPGQ
ncbi:MAG: hypothetical protein WKF36_10150 [Candidatus Nitrosocosmicus sp.]